MASKPKPPDDRASEERFRAVVKRLLDTPPMHKAGPKERANTPKPKSAKAKSP